MRSPAVATILDAPPTIVTPNPLAALDEVSANRASSSVASSSVASSSVASSSVASSKANASPPGDALDPPTERRPGRDAPNAPPPLARADSVIELAHAKRESDSEIGGGRAFPRSESAVSEAPAYVPPKRAKRATSQRDYDDEPSHDPIEDAMTSADLNARLREQNQAPPEPPADFPRPGSYLEYAMRAGLPRKADTEGPTNLPPPARDSEFDILPVPTKILNAALDFPEEKSGFDIKPVPTKILNAALDFPEEKSEFDIKPVPTKILDAALRFDSHSDAKATVPTPPATTDEPRAVPLPSVRPPGKAPLPPPGTPRDLPKLALGDAPAKVATPTSVAATNAPTSATKATSAPSATSATSAPAIAPITNAPTIAPSSRAESEFDYSSLAFDNDASNRLVVQAAPRANSALERALRDSNASIDVPIDMNESGATEIPEIDEDGDFGAAIAPVRTMQLPERAPSIAGADRTEMPILQLAVYENAANLQAAMAGIVNAGHVITVSTSEREHLERIGIAMTDGHLDVVLVGIPGGEVLIKAALSMAPWGPVVIAACSGTATDATRQANSVGADLVAIRPHDANRLGPVLLAAARILEQRRDFMAAQQGREESLLSRLGSEADSDEVGGLLGFDAFQRALELELKRVRRYQYPLSLGLFSLDIASTQPPPTGIKGILRARAGNALLHSIRDIDMATELDQDRFLVLLPYTDLRGATEVARRIIGAVGAIAPVVAAGGEFQPKLVGAITGAKPGQQLSFGKLIRDAQRALEAARRDGAELAVQP